jgi:calpain-15
MKLFITEEVTTDGAYQLRFCKNCEWVTVTIDDYLPCYPNTSDPIFSANTSDTVLWLQLLQKAYAKLHGSYTSLLNGDPSQLLTDLTGFPTITLCLRDESLYGLIEVSKDFQRALNAYLG